MRTEVHNYGDRGLFGLTVDPQFPTRPYIYALYTYDVVRGGTAPQWGTRDTASDPCLAPPLDGCVVQGRLSQLPVDVSSMTATSENVLVEGSCQQYDGNGAAATDSVRLTPGVVNSPPVPVNDTPAKIYSGQSGSPSTSRATRRTSRTATCRRRRSTGG